MRLFERPDAQHPFLDEYVPGLARVIRELIISPALEINVSVGVGRAVSEVVVPLRRVDGLSGPLYNRKAVCFYVRQPFGGYEATSTFDGSDFVVREYALDDELVPLTRPAALRGHPYHHVTWKELRDFPSISKYCGLFDEAVYRALCEVKDFTFENHSGIKIGGWPTPVQRDQEYPGSHDLQIDMTENFMYGDSGIGYLSRDGERWYVTFDCC